MGRAGGGGGWGRRESPANGGEWGRRERRDSKIESRPSRARARAGERGEWARGTQRTRGRGRRGPEEAEAWARRFRARRRRLEEGDGSDRWGPPVGVPGREGGAAWAGPHGGGRAW